MATANHTPAPFDELGMLPDAAARLVSALQGATLADLTEALARKRMPALERRLMHEARAILNGDTEAADRWMEDCTAFDYEGLTDRENALRGLVDTLAETCTA